MIKVLSEDLINKIAAGEVIERPASVVKELVENSIDAGATQIIVEVQGAGKKLMRVSDNGAGLAPGEIELALQRHATSKLATLDDLFHIKTLGFRGEALPSIASVAKMTIAANPAGAGLTVDVKDLFHNTPARKKFLKADSTETGHIGEIVAKYVLANPQIAFRFTADGKPLISSPGSGRLADAVLAIYGAELARELVAVDHAFAGGRVHGLVSRPTISRLDKNYETFFVNGRFVRNFLLNRALEEAYRTLIPSGRYPVAILFVEIDPGRVDVNVHPTKREVKFVNNSEVMEALRAGVREALAKVVSVGEEASLVWGKGYEGGSADQIPMTDFITSIPTHIPSPILAEGNTTGLTPIYQFKDTYIVATDGEELTLIDQHAAHERILYDLLCRESRVCESQALLVPETVELSAGEAAGLQENLEYLNSLGFDLEPFGQNSYIMRAVPAVSSKVSARQLLLDVVADVQADGRSVQVEVKRENIRKYVACHSAIKAGDRLTQIEMARLVRDLLATPNPLTCPHGRPTMIRLTEADLARQFGR